jgi:hypothetical protein
MCSGGILKRVLLLSPTKELEIRKFRARAWKENFWHLAAQSTLAVDCGVFHVIPNVWLFRMDAGFGVKAAG